MGKSLVEGYPSHPPPCTAPGFGDSHTWKNTKLIRQAPNPAAQMIRQSEITQQWSNISRCFFHTKMCIPFLLLIAVANCAHLLSMCLAGENGTLYSEGRAYKRAPNLVAIPQSTALHPTGNISAEDSVHKNKVGHNSTHGIVTLCYFSCRNYCCTKSTFPTSYVD